MDIASATPQVIQLNSQQFQPLNARRTFDSEETQQIDRSLQRPFAKFRAGYLTPIHELLASPTKQASIVGGAAATAVMSGLTMLIKTATPFSKLAESSPKTALVAVGAGVLAGTAAGASTFLDRRRKNEDYLDIMSRLPKGATKRDYDSDPVVQQDQSLNIARANARSARMMATSDVIAGASIAGSVISDWSSGSNQASPS
ncbi:MAG TPA: hypothetical protein VEY30_00285 [Myxococcaceae bacterium]|nr:hypothetical protein [Myxococcaceae bacterium]